MEDTQHPVNRKIANGQDLYTWLRGQGNGRYGSGKIGASEYLASIGIPGNKHLSGQIAGNVTGAYNYVIWDQAVLDRIALLERNGEKLDAMRDRAAFSYAGPKAATALLVSFRTFFEGFWGDRIALQPYDETSRVFLFFSFHKFNKLLAGDWRFSEVRPEGHYRAAVDVVTVHTDAGDRRDAADALVHEAAHQQIDQRIYSRGHAASRWIAEGLASYFEHTLQDRDGVFHAGKIGAATLPNQKPGAG